LPVAAAFAGYVVAERVAPVAADAAPAELVSQQQIAEIYLAHLQLGDY